MGYHQPCALLLNLQSLPLLLKKTRLKRMRMTKMRSLSQLRSVERLPRSVVSIFGSFHVISRKMFSHPHHHHRLRLATWSQLSLKIRRNPHEELPRAVYHSHRLNKFCLLVPMMLTSLLLKVRSGGHKFSPVFSFSRFVPRVCSPGSLSCSLCVFLHFSLAA